MEFSVTTESLRTAAREWIQNIKEEVFLLGFLFEALKSTLSAIWALLARHADKLETLVSISNLFIKRPMF